MTAKRERFDVKFWGVRGSIACPGKDTVRYGGNTPCVEMVAGGHRLIFDGGTGLRVLGQNLLAAGKVEAHLFFTHTHWDHIQGFPFFMPAFVKGNVFHIYGGKTSLNSTLEQSLKDQMRNPHFPVPLGRMEADLTFHEVEPGDLLDIAPGVNVRTAKLNHPGGALGYRVEWKGHAAAYVTDTEHYPDQVDENVLELVRGVDVLIHDCTYTDDEYDAPGKSKKGWGHATWQAVIQLAKAANVQRVIIFHHDPAHDDDFLDDVERHARAVFPAAMMAREGMIVSLR